MRHRSSSRHAPRRVPWYLALACSALFTAPACGGEAPRPPKNSPPAPSPAPPPDAALGQPQAPRATENTPPPLATATAPWDPHWLQAIGGLSTQAPRGVAVDAAGNVYAVGYTEGETAFSSKHNITATGASDGFVAKFSPGGDLSWVVVLSSASDDAINTVAITNDGVVVGGNVGGKATFGTIAVSSNGSDDAFVAAISADGHPRWATTFGGSDSDGVNAIAARDSRIWVAGSFRNAMTVAETTLTPVRGTDAFLVELDGNGMAKRAFAYGDRGEDSAMALAMTPTGGLIALLRFTDGVTIGTHKLMSAGSGTTDLAVIAFNPAMSARWVTALGNEFNNIPGGLAALPDGGVVVAGSYDYALTLGAQRFVAKGASDVFLARLSEAGVLTWAITCGGGGEDIIYGTATNAAGAIAITGWFEQSMSCGRHAVVSQGGKDAFLAAFTENGELTSLMRFGDEDHDQGRAIANHGDTWAVAGVFRIALRIGQYSQIQTPAVAPPRRADGFIAALRAP